MLCAGYQAENPEPNSHILHPAGAVSLKSTKASASEKVETTRAISVDSAREEPDIRESHFI